MFDGIFKKSGDAEPQKPVEPKTQWEARPQPGQVSINTDEVIGAGKALVTDQAVNLKKYFKPIIGAVAVIAVAVIGIQWWVSVSSADRTEMRIESPALVKVGERTEFSVFLVNRQKKQELKDVSFTFRADSGTKFIDAEALGLYQKHVSSLAPMAQEQQDIKAVFWGKQGEERTIEVSARYRIGDNANRFEKTQPIKVTISDTAAQLLISLPQQAITDQEFRSSVEYRKLTSNEWENGRLILELPQNFSLVRSDPETKEVGTLAWPWDVLIKQENSKVVFDGIIASSEGQAKEFKAKFFVTVRNADVLVSEITEELAIISNPLALTIIASEDPNYAPKPGDTIRYRVNFKNNYDVALKDVVIQADPSDTWFVPGSYKVGDNGFYSSRDKRIVWNGGTTPQLLVLNPRESGTVTFEAQLLDNYPENAREQIITVRAGISTQTKPKDVGSNIQTEAILETKIKGMLEIIPRLVFRDDPQTGFTNSGTIPLRANQATQYTLYLTARAIANPFESVNLKTILPANVSFDGKIKGDAAGLIYNPRTGELSWTIDRIDAYVSKTVVLQLTAIPSNDQVGKLIMICDDMTTTATDAFTRSEISVVSKKIMSDLPDDDSIDINSGRVSP